MTDTLIQLGTFVFRNLEIPTKISFGGNQQLVQHDLIGGTRIVDSLGGSDTDITWEGLITGADSMARAQTLNQMRVAGLPLSLRWFNLTYQVVISNFVASTERYYQVSYQLSMRVITDGYNPNPTQTTVSFNEAVNSDFAALNTLANTVDIPTVSSSVASLGQTIEDTPTLNGASPQTIAPVAAQAQSTLDVIEDSISNFVSNLFG